MQLRLDVQYATRDCHTPSTQAIRRWVETALKQRRDTAELTVRIVDKAEGQALNRRFRKRETATNVLSFPCAELEHRVCDLLGDVVICAPVVIEEACAQDKQPEAHWAHMVVHGTLHLLGFDHLEPEQADIMEHTETTILSGLGFADPYSPTMDQ